MHERVESQAREKRTVINPVNENQIMKKETTIYNAKTSKGASQADERRVKGTSDKNYQQPEG